MEPKLPEKARLLQQLKDGGFNVPDFIYIPAEDFKNNRLAALESFLNHHKESFKVIARSAHVQEEFYKGGTFDSLETYADLSGILYARNRMIKNADSNRRLSILRQKKFNHAPDIDPDEMGIIVMPFIDGSSVMAKLIGKHWEFGYCRDRIQKVQSDPFITKTPHDRRLLDVSKKIQAHLGFRCEIEYIISKDNEIHVVQAKDISNIEILELRESERTIKLDGIRRIRKQRNFRERPVFVMDNRSMYMNIINICEEMLSGKAAASPNLADILAIIRGQEEEMEAFALSNQRFAVLDLAEHVPEELYHVANHYLEEMPTLQKQLSAALYQNLYNCDMFLAESDTLLSKDRIRVNLCSHEAYGINTVRNPLWNVFWQCGRHEQIVKDFRRLGFKTGDTIAIEIDAEEKPMVSRH
ncbi:MAG: hypothetical protein RBT11_14790 [Desulfobacterales bacterium]|jgi:hypothetical protein|nr:hypothetical protein [Desulfobacterales bacterium]